MKIRPFSLIAAPVFALALPVLAQEPTASPVATATPGTPAPSATPAPTAAPSATPSPTAAASPSPAATPESSPSPAADAAQPTASPAGEANADILPEPTDASLGAPVDAAGELPAADASAPSDLPDPDALIPADSSPTGDVPPAPPVAQENKYEKERKLLVRYQEVKLQALKDPAVRSLRQQADAARTDEAKRQALREYYRLLYAKMTAIDAKLQRKCDAMLQAYLRRLGQFRVTPTIPLNPPPTPAPLEGN